MKIKKLLTSSSVALTTLAMSAQNVFAQVTKPDFSTVDTNEAGFRIDDLGTLLQGVLNLVLFIAALLVFAYLIWGGVQWITSGGDKGKTEEARNKITAAIVGIAVIAAAYAVFRIVLYVVGVEDPFQQGLPENITFY